MITLPILIRALYRANNAEQLLNAFMFFRPAKSFGAWLLIHPQRIGSQILLRPDAASLINEPLASQLAKIPYSDFAHAAGVRAPWAAAVIEVVEQLGVEMSAAVCPIWVRGELVALAGISNASATGNKNIDSRALAFDLAQAALRLHEIEMLKRESKGVRGLLKRSNKAILIVESDGRVFACTAVGLDALLTLSHGVNRPNGARSIPPLPVKLLQAISGVSKRTEIKLSNRAVAWVTPIAGEVNPLALPLLELELFVRSPVNREVISPQRLALLSTRERELLGHLLRGLRNKEIASICNITAGTVHNHVSQILKKLSCSDRLELLARASGMRMGSEVPPLGAVDSIQFN